MKILLGLVQSVLMVSFFALSFFSELFELTNTHLFIVLIVISIIFILLTFYEYKKYNNTKLAFWGTVECIIFIVTSLLDTFEIIEFQTYVTINLFVDGVGFWLDGKLNDGDQSGDDQSGTDQSGDGSMIEP